MARKTRSTSLRRPVTLAPHELQEMAEAWAEKMFAPLPGSHPAGGGWTGRQTLAVIVQTEDRVEDATAKGLERRLARNLAVRTIISGAAACVENGDIAAARSVVEALPGRDLPAVHWCECVTELAAVLVDCVRSGEQCYESGSVEGPAGRVVSMFVWYDPSHPVGPS